MVKVFPLPGTAITAAMPTIELAAASCSLLRVIKPFFFLFLPMLTSRKPIVASFFIGTPAAFPGFIVWDEYCSLDALVDRQDFLHRPQFIHLRAGGIILFELGNFCLNENIEPRLAEIAEKYLHKGARIAVVGILDQKRWEDEGVTKTSFQIIANFLEFIK